MFRGRASDASPCLGFRVRSHSWRLTNVMAGTTAMSIGSKRTIPGSVSALTAKLLRLTQVSVTGADHQEHLSQHLEPFREAPGDKLVKALERGHVKAIIDAKAVTLVAANHFLRALRRPAIPRAYRLIRTANPGRP